MALFSRVEFLERIAKTKKSMAKKGMEVLKEEPPDYNQPLFGLENILVTPHTAFYSENSVEEVRLRTANAIVNVCNGILPEDIVNKDVLGNGKLRMDIAGYNLQGRNA